MPEFLHNKATKNPVFLALAFASDMHQIFQNFESFYNILHILTQVIQTSSLVTHFCMQAIFKVFVSNTFPTHKTIYFKIILVLDVPEKVKPIRLTESFRQIYALVSLARLFHL